MGKLHAIGVGLAAVAVCGCGGPEPKPPRQVAPKPFAGATEPTTSQLKQAKQVADAVNEFAFRLANKVAAGNAQGNMLVSPLSISVAHSMLLAGTTGDTQKELLSALAYGSLAPPDVHQGMFALAYTATRNPQSELCIANGLFVLQPLKLNPGFVKTLRESYDADIARLNGAGPDSVAKINDWVREKTRGMIPKVVDELDPKDVFVLTNAASFIGNWEEPFEPSNTRDGDFALAGGRKIKTPMMNGEKSFRYSNVKGQTFLELPYEQQAYRMVVLMPAAGSSPVALLRNLGASRWTAMLGHLREEDGIVSLPKFTLDADYDLIPYMESLGVKKLFSRQAELGGVGEVGSQAGIEMDVHLSHIEVDEEGTKAAAATAMAKPGEAEPSPLEVKIDRPFLYAIVHQKTGVIVFLGICNDPTQNK
jgi:serine protease inhibitor